VIKIILNWILKNAHFRLFSSTIPQGQRFGGHDVKGVVDSYIILEIIAAGRIVLLGHFQTS